MANLLEHDASEVKSTVAALATRIDNFERPRFGRIENNKRRVE